MSIIKTKTNDYGPATMDIQIEQGCDFSVSLTLSKNSLPWDLTGCTFQAKLSPTWSPGASEIDLVVTETDLAAGQVTISLPGSATDNIGLPSPPSKTKSSVDSRKFKFGGWTFRITDTDGVTTRYIEGDVVLDRDPVQG